MGAPLDGANCREKPPTLTVARQRGVVHGCCAVQTGKTLAQLIDGQVLPRIDLPFATRSSALNDTLRERSVEGGTAAHHDQSLGIRLDGFDQSKRALDIQRRFGRRHVSGDALETRRTGVQRTEDDRRVRPDRGSHVQHGIDAEVTHADDQIHRLIRVFLALERNELRAERLIVEAVGVDGVGEERYACRRGGTQGRSQRPVVLLHDRKRRVARHQDHDTPGFSGRGLSMRCSGRNAHERTPQQAQQKVQDVTIGQSAARGSGYVSPHRTRAPRVPNALRPAVQRKLKSKTRFQSRFMSTTVHPRVPASSSA